MTSYAMRFTGVLGGKPDAPKDILSRRHQSHMARIHAQSVTAEMVDVQPLGDRSSLGFPCQSMNEDLADLPAFADTEESIFTMRPRPQPTVVRLTAVYSAPQADSRGDRTRSVTCHREEHYSMPTKEEVAALTVVERIR